MFDAPEIELPEMRVRQRNAELRADTALDVARGIAASADPENGWDTDALEEYAARHFRGQTRHRQPTLADIGLASDILWARNARAQTEASIELLRIERSHQLAATLQARFAKAAAPDSDQIAALNENIQVQTDNVESLLRDLDREQIPSDVLRRNFDRARTEDHSQWLSRIDTAERYLCFNDARLRHAFNNAVILGESITELMESEMAADYLVYLRRRNREGKNSIDSARRVSLAASQTAPDKIADLAYTLDMPLAISRAAIAEYTDISIACRQMMSRPKLDLPAPSALRH